MHEDSKEFQHFSVVCKKNTLMGRQTRIERLALYTDKRLKTNILTC